MNSRETEVKEVAKILNLEEILGADDVKYATVPWPGGLLRIGSLTADDMITFVETNEGPAKKTAGLRLIIKSLVDEHGTRIGTDEILGRLRKKSASGCNAIVEAILILNGLDKKSREAGVAKNDSGEAVSDASPTE